MLIAVVFLVGLLVPASVVDANSPALSLAALCKGDKVNLRTIEQLNSLVGQLESSGADCSDTVKDALKDMKKLTHANGDDACTMSQARAITSFVDNYLKDAPDGTKRGLPEPLEKFAIAYGMKVSGICSHRMVRELPMSTEFGLNRHPDGQMSQFLKLLSNDSPIGNLLDPIIKTGEVILPVDLMQAIPGLVEHVHLLVPQTMGMLKLKHLCQEFFQPLYEPLLLPLAHLIRAGFNNREHYWAWRYHYKGRLWSRAVFLCELAKTFGPDSKVQINDPGREAVTTELPSDDQSRSEHFLANTKSSPFPVGKTPTLKAGDTIYGRFDFSMKSLVKAFDANKDHVQLLRERILRRSFRVARQIFKKKGFSTELIKTLKAVRIQSGSEAADFEVAKEKFVSLMNSPQSDSVAYKSLVSSSKYLYDHIACLIGVAILIVPATALTLTAPGKFARKAGKSVARFFNNYVATRDRGPEKLMKRNLH